MVRDGARWREMAEDRERECEMTGDGGRWHEMVGDGERGWEVQGRGREMAGGKWHLVPRDEADARESVEEVAEDGAVEGRRAAAHRGAVVAKRRAKARSADADEHGKRGDAERLRVGHRAVGCRLRRARGEGELAGAIINRRGRQRVASEFCALAPAERRRRTRALTGASTPAPA